MAEAEVVDLVTALRGAVEAAKKRRERKAAESKPACDLLIDHGRGADVPATDLVRVSCGCTWLLCAQHARRSVAEAEYMAAIADLHPDRAQRCTGCERPWTPTTTATRTALYR